MGFVSPELRQSAALFAIIAAGCASTVLEVEDGDPANPRAHVPPLPAAPRTLEPGFDPKDQPRSAEPVERDPHAGHSMGETDPHAGHAGHVHDHHAHDHAAATNVDAAVTPTELDGGPRRGGER